MARDAHGVACIEWLVHTDLEMNVYKNEQIKRRTVGKSAKVKQTQRNKIA